MTKTKIEWADRVWNPVTGCSKVSEGCRNCYAERIAQRFWGERKFTDVWCHEDRLDQPLHWRKPARVFVNSMSDLFHRDVPGDFILRVWIQMAKAHDHTFIILTKRPERMQMLLTEWLPPAWALATATFKLLTKPLKNVWLGVSIEDQATADERIPLLLRTPAAKRVVSYEPALGSVDLKLEEYRENLWGEWKLKKLIDWIIMGGESGPGARPMHPDWARSVRDQCQAAGVPFFFKQWGAWLPMPSPDVRAENEGKTHVFIDGQVYVKTGKKSAGRLLDGDEWNEVLE